MVEPTPGQGGISPALIEKAIKVYFTDAMRDVPVNLAEVARDLKVDLEPDSSRPDSVPYGDTARIDFRRGGMPHVLELQPRSEEEAVLRILFKRCGSIMVPLGSIDLSSIPALGQGKQIVVEKVLQGVSRSRIFPKSRDKTDTLPGELLKRLEQWLVSGWPPSKDNGAESATSREQN